jgi:RNA polymerase sigma-70 factor (ECF subfamily)
VKLLVNSCVFIIVGQMKGGIGLETDEAKIIKLCKHNKREGYNLLFKKYEKYIYGLCFRYTASREDALDLLQDIYIKIYKAMPGFKEGQPILPWIKKITVNTCLNFVTRRKNNTLSLDMTIDDDGNLLEDMVASSVSVDDEVICRSTKILLEDAIQNLPGDMKMAVILRHIEGMSYEDIAKAMSAPVGTVKSLLFRGRSALKEKLQASGVWEV